MEWRMKGKSLVERITWFTIIIVLMTVGTIIFSGLGDIASQGDNYPPTGSGSLPPGATTTTIPTYDLDGDRRPDYGLIGDEVVAVPRHEELGWPAWLPFLASIWSAALVALGAVAVGLLNRSDG